jgi:hypothetical protein
MLSPFFDYLVLERRICACKKQHSELRPLERLIFHPLVLLVLLAGILQISYRLVKKKVEWNRVASKPICVVIEGIDCPRDALPEMVGVIALETLPWDEMGWEENSLDTVLED